MPNITAPFVITDSAQINPGTIVDSDISASAAVAQSKLNLSITNTEVNASAAIVDTKLAQIATASKVSGAALTSLSSIPAGAGVIPAANVPAGVSVKSVAFTINAGQASGTQAIAHGLGKTPVLALIVARAHVTSATGVSLGAEVSYDGTTQASTSSYSTNTGASTTDGSFTVNKDFTNGTNVGVVTFDGTNVNIAWTKTGSPGGTYYAILTVLG